MLGLALIFSALAASECAGETAFGLAGTVVRDMLEADGLGRPWPRDRWDPELGGRRFDLLPDGWLAGEDFETTPVALFNLNNSGLTRSTWLAEIGADTGRPIYRRFHMTCIDGRWRVSDIRLSPEELNMSQLLIPEAR